MQKIYDRKSSITWPDGTTMEAGELMAHPIYGALFKSDHILDCDEDGVVLSFTGLKPFKDAYGIDEEDPEKALTLVRAAQEAEREKLAIEAASATELSAVITKIGEPAVERVRGRKARDGGV